MNHRSSLRSAAKGFSPIMVIAIIAAIAIISAGGWLVWQQNQDDDRTHTNSSQTPDTQKDQAKDKTPEQQTPNDPSEGGKYFVVKEWGVRFPVPSEINGTLRYIFAHQDPNTLVIDTTAFPQGAECPSFSLVRTTEQVKTVSIPTAMTAVA